jgi:arylsulfatase A-like enzyme
MGLQNLASPVRAKLVSPLIIRLVPDVSIGLLVWAMAWRMVLVCASLLSVRCLSPVAPNIVIYLVDDLGWRDTSVYGSTGYETPNIDRLAEKGIRFTDAYAPNPMCTPTRASLLTGRYPSRFHITQPEGHLPPQHIPRSGYPSGGLPHLPYICPVSARFLDPVERTIASYLRTVGYKTGFFGKWHLGLPRWAWPENFGFDVTWHGHPDNGPPLPNGYFSPYSFANHSLQAISSKEYLVERVTDESIRFIQSHRTAPFFLLLSQFGVHAPWQARLKDIQRHSDSFEKKTNVSTDSQRNPIMAAMIGDLDESVGRVVEALTALDLMDNTFFIFTSDNGGEVGVHSFLHRTLQKAEVDPGLKLPEWMRTYRHYAGLSAPTSNAPLRGGKGSLYEGGLRIPLIITYPPLIKPGTVSATPVSIIDLFPTIHQLVASIATTSVSFSQRALKEALTGFAATKARFRDKATRLRFDGLSLLPLLEDSSHELGRTELYGFYPHGPVAVAGVSLRSQQWKFIRRFAPSLPSRDGGNEGKGAGAALVHELYDLSRDIGETVNLAASSPALVKKFNLRIEHFLSSTRSLPPIPNPAYNETLAAMSGHKARVDID